MRARIAHGGRVTRLLAASAVAGIATGAAFGLSTAEVPVDQASARQAAAAPVVEHQPAAGSIETSLVVERTGTVEPAEASEPECERRAAASAPPAYGWPVKPFHRQHPVRGYFGDPRVGPGTDGTIRRSFHFGVDVSAPDGTAVYATASGVVAGNSLHSDVIEIVRRDGVELSYWHVTPAVRPGQRVVAYETLIGHIDEGWGHVHFSERRNGSYVNPLRPGAMGPYADGTCPAVKQVRFERDGERMHARSVHGTVDVVVGTFDPPAVSAPTPWRDLPVTPALVEWRIISDAGRVVEPWRTAHDARSTLPTGSFESTYAIRTRQNRPNRAGTYRFYLAEGWASSDLRNGSYAVEVRVVDTHGNRARSSWPFVVAN